MQQKYSSHGYIKLWITNSPNAEKLQAIRSLIDAPEELRKVFDRLYAEETA
jgi:uncharacterized protein